MFTEILFLTNFGNSVCNSLSLLALSFFGYRVLSFGKEQPCSLGLYYNNNLKCCFVQWLNQL